ncbi:hypothetical protein C8R45DRAFT_1095984 [Mycena sanguinolenta]|nr:hypothetical protein C8R45DRAFT_1095984 [Mycena sanguinolenta]
MFLHFALGLTVLVLSSGLSSASSLVLSSWRKPNITTSLADRVSIAQAALDRAISGLSPDNNYDGAPWGITGLLFSQLADFDRITNQTMYHDKLTQLFAAAAGVGGRTNFSDELSYGYGGVRAYAAYKDQTFLDYATQAWWFGRIYTLTAAQAASGVSPIKNFTIQSNCQGISMEGGTFWNNDTAEPTLTVIATGYFLATSALLAEVTSDNMFLQAAIDSMTFIHSHLLSVLNIAQDSMSGAASDSCRFNNLIEPISSGVMIEGLAILYSLSKNETIQTLLDDIVTATIPNSAWSNAQADGIIAYPQNGAIRGDLELVRGLVAAYVRNATSPQLHYDLGKYLAVQYNAVLDLATASGSNVYGYEWVGPPSSAFSGVNQTGALSILVGAISLQNDTDPSGASASTDGSTPGGPTSSGTSPNRKKTPIGAIVGGVAGGVALLALAAVFVLSRRRRRRRAQRRYTQHYLDRRHSGEPILSMDPAMMVEAFVYPPQDPASGSGGASGAAAGTGTGQATAGGKADMRPPRPVHAPTSVSASAISASTATTTTGEGPVSAMPTTRRSALPTEELVRMLNERLQEQTWEEGETPPEYMETR